MDDAQRAEKRRLGGKSSKSDGLKLRRNKNRCWFPELGFQSGLVKLYVKKMADSTLHHQPPKKHKSVTIL